MGLTFHSFYGSFLGASFLHLELKITTAYFSLCICCILVERSPAPSRAPSSLLGGRKSLTGPWAVTVSKASPYRGRSWPWSGQTWVRALPTWPRQLHKHFTTESPQSLEEVTIVPVLQKRKPNERAWKWPGSREFKLFHHNKPWGPVPLQGRGTGG